MRNPVTVTKKKYNGRISHSWQGDLVGGDDDWLVASLDDPGETSNGTKAAHALQYLAVDRPLVVQVSFDAIGKVLEYQCDACMPAQVQGRVITWVDLDLDVIAAADLSFYLRDFDDFARNAREMSYAPEAVEQAGAGVNLALSLIRERRVPFDGSASRVLGQVLAAEGPL